MSWGNPFKDAWNSATDAAKQTAAQIATGAKQVAAIVVKAADTAADKVAAATQWAKDTTAKLAKDVGQKVEQVSKAAQQTAIQAAKTVQQKAAPAVAALTKVAAVTANNVKQIFSNVIKTFGDVNTKEPVAACPIAAPDATGFGSIFQVIKIGGDATFQARVKADLSRIYQTPTGNGLLLSIRDTGKNVEIHPLSPEDAAKWGPYTRADSYDFDPDWLGRPGKGAGSSIFYDPDDTSLGERFSSLPPGIVLAHELIHSEHNATGTSAKGLTDNDQMINPAYDKLGKWDPRRLLETKYVQVNREEVETAGIPPDDKRQFTENKIRNEWQPPQAVRPYY